MSQHYEAVLVQLRHNYEDGTARARFVSEIAKVGSSRCTPSPSCEILKAAALATFESTRRRSSGVMASRGHGLGPARGGGWMGAILGTVLGLGPAPFTAGLSIPAGAALGLCVGVAAGAATEALGGVDLGRAGSSCGAGLLDCARAVCEPETPLSDDESTTESPVSNRFGAPRRVVHQQGPVLLSSRNQIPKHRGTL